MTRPSWQRTWPRWRRSRCRSSGLGTFRLGEWLGLPLATLAGSVRIGDAAFEEVFHPIAERLLERCDALLRVGGPSEGADRMVAGARARGLAGYHALREGPRGATTAALNVRSPMSAWSCRPARP